MGFQVSCKRRAYHYPPHPPFPASLPPVLRVQVTNSERAAAIAKQLAEEVKGQQGKVEAALLKQKEAAASLQQELDKATEGRKSVQAQLAAAEEKVCAPTDTWTATGCCWLCETALTLQGCK